MSNPVFEEGSVYTIHRPSRDHCEGILFLPVVRSDSGRPPLMSIRYSSPGWARPRAARYIRRSPRGDHSGWFSTPASRVRRESVSRASRSQMSGRLLSVIRAYAIDLPSGEIAGVLPGKVPEPNGLPERSTQPIRLES